LAALYLRAPGFLTIFVLLAPRYNQRVANRRSTEKAEISAIYEVGKILTSTQNLPRALGTSLRTLQSLLGFDRAAILLPDSATREIRMEVSPATRRRSVPARGTCGGRESSGRR